MKLTDLYALIPASQHDRITVCSDGKVYVRTPKNYFAASTPEKVITLGTDRNGDLFRISNGDIPDAVASKLDDWGIR